MSSLSIIKIKKLIKWWLTVEICEYNSLRYISNKYKGFVLQWQAVFQPIYVLPEKSHPNLNNRFIPSCDKVSHTCMWVWGTKTYLILRCVKQSFFMSEASAYGTWV